MRRAVKCQRLLVVQVGIVFETPLAENAFTIVDPDLYPFGCEALLKNQIAIVVVVNVSCGDPDDSPRGMECDLDMRTPAHVHFDAIGLQWTVSVGSQEHRAVQFLVFVEVRDSKLPADWVRPIGTPNRLIQTSTCEQGRQEQTKNAERFGEESRHFSCGHNQRSVVPAWTARESQAAYDP
jgi:hypothetical protein